MAQFTLRRGLLVCVFLGLVLVDFVVKRNKLTGNHSYAIFYFTILLILFPRVMEDGNAIFCSLFLLLALRRLISFRSLKSLRLKIFDATFWILIAGLFYAWAVLFLLVVWVAIGIFEPKNIKNWLAMLPAVACYFMLTYTVLMLTGDTDFLSTHYAQMPSFAQLKTLSWPFGLKSSIYAVLVLLLGVLALVRLGNTGLGKLLSFRMLFIFFVLGVIMSFLTMGQQQGTIIVTFFPAVVFLSYFTEGIRRKQLLETVLTISLLLPISLFVIRLIVG